MPKTTLRELIERIWKSRKAELFSVENLFNQIRFDGGQDAMGLTASDVAALLDDSGLENWNSARFTFSENLGLYPVIAHTMSNQQVAAAAFSMCVVADAARAGKCDWRLQHDKVMRLCAVLSEKIELEDFLLVMAYLFGKGGESPIHREG